MQTFFPNIASYQIHLPSFLNGGGGTLSLEGMEERSFLFVRVDTLGGREMVFSTMGMLLI